ncbi:MAG: hypothetical protein DRJ64_06770 [Thermoprotei archaeon]|nr:MAG: hypothetical protein DRJ64_06770 [Thermoprotei archaeon]
MSEKIVSTVEKVDPLEFLAEKANTVIRLRKRTENLIKLIEERYKEDQNLSKLVENILNTVTPPEPPPEKDILYTGYNIASYETKLNSYLKTLTKYTMALEELSQNLNELKEKLQHLQEWNAIIQNIDPYFLLEGSKLLNRANKILDELSLEDPVNSSNEIKMLSSSIDRHLRLVKKIFVKRINELLGEIGELDTLLSKVCLFAKIEERPELDKMRERIGSIRKLLENAKMNPRDCPINFSSIKKEIMQMKEQVKNFLKSKISEKEERVLATISRTSHVLDKRKIGFSYLVELISKENGIPISETLDLLYKLEKKKVIKLYISLQ